MKPADADHPTLRDAVLDAADALFFLRGFHRVAIDEIRDAAGVSLKALYGQFPSKQAIVDAYLARRDHRWRDLLESYVTSRSADPGEQLLLTFDGLSAYLRSAKQVPHCAFQQAYGQLAGGPADAVEMIRSHKADVQANFVRRARSAGLREPQALGQQLMLLFEGALITGAVQQDPRAGQTARAAAAVLITAAAAEPTLHAR
ncbi:MAG: TetR/AcrR family transcriptional regulator [Actinomycetota bacterium]|nr:TetR/AcrR family transcriptional regulator [Actinomycetota bacterium]